MKIEINKDHTAGRCTESWRLSSGNTAIFLFSFSWDEKKKQLTRLDDGKVISDGKTLATFEKVADSAFWTPNDERCLHRELSAILQDISGTLEKALSEKGAMFNTAVENAALNPIR